MYFHLIGIKEKWESQYELNLLISWWDEDFVRNFLSNRWVVVVSINIFKDDPNTFGNISISTVFKDTEVQIITQWDDLSERMYFFVFLWLTPKYINFINNPIPEVEMFQLLDATFNKVKSLNEELENQKKEEELHEQKKYEESSIKDWLKVINHNIDYMEQIIKAWEWIIEWSELKKIDDCLNEMKKVRLWTNFNKMASLILDAHALTKKAESEILQAYDSQKFLIDKNSSITNIDIIHEIWIHNRISEKGAVAPKMLTGTESVIAVLWSPGIFLQLLKRDFAFTFKQTNFREFFKVLMNTCEYFVLTGILSITILWLIAPLIGFQNFSLYLLPACGFLWLLLYLFNSLNFKSIVALIWGFIALVIIYRRGLLLLLNTFAM